MATAVPAARAYGDQARPGDDHQTLDMAAKKQIQSQLHSPDVQVRIDRRIVPCDGEFSQQIHRPLYQVEDAGFGSRLVNQRVLRTRGQKLADLGLRIVEIAEVHAMSGADGYSGGRIFLMSALRIRRRLGE